MNIGHHEEANLIWMPLLRNCSWACHAARTPSRSVITSSRARSMVSVSVFAPSSFCARPLLLCDQRKLCRRRVAELQLSGGRSRGPLIRLSAGVDGDGVDERDYNSLWQFLYW